MHSVYDEEVGLSPPLTAEVQFVDCVIRALFSVGRKKSNFAEGNCCCTNHPDLSHL